MREATRSPWYIVALLMGLCASAHATVKIVGLTPSVASPQVLGTSVTWKALAKDSNSGPLTFQFQESAPGASLTVTRDFNVGTMKNGTWHAPTYVWVPTDVEGQHTIEVVVKDFTSGETASMSATYMVTPLVTGSTPVVVATANPLVALFGSPSCPAGSTIQVKFQPQSGTVPPTVTSAQPCNPTSTSNFEIGGMYPSTTYTMFAQVIAGGKPTVGPSVTFTTGALPTNIPFPTFTQAMPPGDTNPNALLLLNPTQEGSEPVYPSVATDLAGNIVWYYWPVPKQTIVLTRPLPGGLMLTLESGQAWDPNNKHLQFLREIDLAGNVVKETNIGVVGAQLLAMGLTDAQECAAVPKPPIVGAACLDNFNHDAIMTLPNGQTAALIILEKIFPAGTQGDTTGLPVDVLGDMFVVLDSNWQVNWYFDSFQHDGGAPQLDISRAPVLGETCVQGQQGCPPLGLIGSGIAPKAPDWLHSNSLYYWPTDSDGGASGDILMSYRNQDWIGKIDYNNGTGTGNILWLLGPCGPFSFNNTYNDPWPWNSSQHEVGIENNGAGPMTIFDNGDTRVSPPTGPGSSTGCMAGVGSGDSRGMALTVDEANLQVSPVLSDDLGVYSPSSGSAQLLNNGYYFFLAAQVLTHPGTASFSIELKPTRGTETGTIMLDLQGTTAYRGWRMPNLYSPPIT